MSKKNEDTRNTELVEQSSNDIVKQSTQRRGFELADKSTLKPPRIKLLQSTSPEVQDEEFADYGFRAGMLINGLLLEKIEGKFIPLMIFDDRALLAPKNEEQRKALLDTVRLKFGVDLTSELASGTVLICRAQDNRNGDRFGKCSECKLCDFDGDRKPFGNKNINVIGVFEEFPDMPCIFRFSSTSYKNGDKFKNLAYYAGGDLFSRKYKLAPAKKSGNGNTWYVLTVKPAGIPNPEELALAEKMYGVVMAANIDLDYEEPEDDSFTTEEY